MISPLAAAAAGAAAGFGIAMPLGAIGVLLLRMGITRGFKPAAAGGLGVATVDLVYSAVAMLAGAGVAHVVKSWGSVPMFVSGGIVIGIGVWQLIGTFRKRGAATDDAPVGAGSTYVRFIVLTALNPVTVLYFVSLSSALASQDVGADARVAFVIASGLASAAWQVTLAGIGAALHRVMSPRVSHVLGVVGSVIVIGLGVAVVWAGFAAT